MNNNFKYLMIYDYERSGKEEEKVEKIKKKNKKVLETHIKHYKERYFHIIYPDSSEEDIVYAKAYGKIEIKEDKWPVGLTIIGILFAIISLASGISGDRDEINTSNSSEKEIKFSKSDDEYREKTLLSLINKLSSDGYTVATAQFALFMNSKLRKLILTK